MRRKTHERALSLVDVMNAIALACILGALAMYFVGSYIRKVKTTEALSSVTSLAQQAADYYEHSDADQPAGTAPEAAHAMRHFPVSSRTSVPDLALVRGKRFQSSPYDWAVAPWADLRFSIHQPQYYAYSFESEGSGLNAHATAIAQGDLDGNAKTSLYRLEIRVDSQFHAHVANPPVVQEE